MKKTEQRQVLVVDDDSIIRETLRILLRSNGFDVVGEASDGIKAMQMLRKHKPDIVLLDISMPGASGLDVLEEIRSELPEVNVVMISGEAKSDIVKKAIEGGAIGYIVKPFNTANVMQNLERALKIAARKRQIASTGSSSQKAAGQ